MYKNTQYDKGTIDSRNNTIYDRPANNLIKYTYKADELIIIDKKIKSDLPAMEYFEKIQAPATIGVEKLAEMLIKKHHPAKEA